MQGRSSSTSGSTLLGRFIDEGDIKLQKIYMKENPADMLIKVLPGVKFAHCKELLKILLVT